MNNQRLMSQKGSLDSFLGVQIRDLTIQQEHYIQQQPTHRTDGSNSVSQFHHQNINNSNVKMGGSGGGNPS